MAIKRIPLSELQRDPVASFKAGAGSPVGVEQDGVVLFFLVSAVDVVTQGLSKPDDPAATPSSPVRTEPVPAVEASSGHDAERTVNVNEAAALTGKSKSTISRNIKQKRLPAQNEGRTLQVKVSDLERLFGLSSE